MKVIEIKSLLNNEKGNGISKASSLEDILEDKGVLQEEYSIIREFYMYQKSLDDRCLTTLEDIIKWIDSTFDEDEEITIDLLKSTLDEYIFHYGMDS